MFSCTTGPLGIVGSGGSGPRFAGTVAQSNASPDESHSQGQPAVAFNRSSSSRRAWPVSTDATQSWIFVWDVMVKATCLLSGDQLSWPICAPAGMPLISRPVPSATRRKESSLSGRVRLRPLVVGLRRRPASRSSGRESSSMEIRFGRVRNSIHSLSGESRTEGVGGASTIACNGCGAMR